MDKLLIAKIAFEATRARDNGHATKGGIPDWFNVSEGVHRNWLATVESGKSEDELVVAVMGACGVKATKAKAAPAPRVLAIASPMGKARAAGIIGARKKKAKKKGR